MDESQRTHFDALVEQQVAVLPYTIQLLLQETPLLVEDRPSPELLDQLGLEAAKSSELCGVFSGIGLTERSVEDSMVEPQTITIFREGVCALVDSRSDSEDSRDEQLAQEIRITILHEEGHHIGLDEDDLEALGFG